jgi:hypothetical protein
VPSGWGLFRGCCLTDCSKSSRAARACLQQANWRVFTAVGWLRALSTSGNPLCALRHAARRAPHAQRSHTNAGAATAVSSVSCAHENTCSARPKRSRPPCWCPETTFANHGAACRVAPARAARPGRGGCGDRARALQVHWCGGRRGMRKVPQKRQGGSPRAHARRSSRARHVLFGAWRAAHEAGSEDHGWAGRGGCVFVVSCQHKARARHSAPRSGALRSPRAGDSRGARPRAAATRRAARHTRRGSGAEGVGAGVSPAGARAPPAPSLGTLGAAGVLRARG